MTNYSFSRNKPAMSKFELVYELKHGHNSWSPTISRVKNAGFTIRCPKNHQTSRREFCRRKHNFVSEIAQ